MRQPDINRVKRAMEHVEAARTHLENIKFENLDSKNCTHEGGGCARNSQVNRQQRNGMYYRTGEVVGIIVCCMNYTGPYADKPYRL